MWELPLRQTASGNQRNKILKFHERKGHNWQAGLERLTNPQIQVLGITGTPHTIFLDEINRVLYHGESILKDERFLDYVEDYYN